ncbi:hypothetical protein ANN_24031 [Periplaneta americana]|uniref:Uncharacterized protein n=1 Tax=Periplaneta americana TaxID=6978 RepID=A0ABQ8S295_PERAM|nr:hypothetical protein ANN_24031 [Periplaneta americana]
MSSLLLYFTRQFIILMRADFSNYYDNFATEILVSEITLLENKDFLTIDRMIKDSNLIITEKKHQQRMKFSGWRINIDVLK